MTNPQHPAPTEAQQLADVNWTKNGIADFIADNWSMRKYSLAEIEAGIRAIEIRPAAAPQAPASGAVAPVALDDSAWYCESHPDKLMGHEGCGGAGILEIARVDIAMNMLRLARQEVRETAAHRDDLVSQLRQQIAALTPPEAPAPAPVVPAGWITKNWGPYLEGSDEAAFLAGRFSLPFSSHTEDFINGLTRLIAHVRATTGGCVSQDAGAVEALRRLIPAVEEYLRAAADHWSADDEEDDGAIAAANRRGEAAFKEISRRLDKARAALAAHKTQSVSDKPGSEAKE